MTPQRYERVCRLFLAARKLDPPGRAEYLRTACGDDAALRAEVESLLSCDIPADTFLHTPALGPDFALPAADAALASASAAARSTSRSAATPPSAAPPPTQIGRYRILELIGQGGMGVVYRAAQDNPRRTVALKVIRNGVASTEMLRRFQFEAEVLARLQHPTIAQIYEVGTAPGGGAEQPFFAMELVQGRTLKEYVAAQTPDLRARLALLARVCDGMHHAHQKGVIHRDLKPGNILVDETGQPKILDFGVARATDPDLRLTIATHAGQIVGTLGYMSPEQVQGRTDEVDIRTDVYSLGAILYELLAGRPPLDIVDKSLLEAARVIADEEPAALGGLRLGIPDDVAAIVAKALEKDKARRYESAATLAEDLRRYLANEPVIARPATTWYRLRKFTRRNRAVAIGLSVAVLALVVGVIGTTTQALRALRQRDRAQAATVVAERLRAEAERQAAIAEAVNYFLNEDLLAKAKPTELGREATIRAALDAAAQLIPKRFADAPLVAAAVRFSVGDAYYALGEYGLATTHLEEALRLRRLHLGPDHAETLRTMSRLGLVCLNTGRWAEAEELLQAAAEGRARLFGEDDSQALATVNHLALLYLRRERLDEAERILKRVLELNARRRGDDSDNALAAMGNLADLYRRQERYAEAEGLATRVLEAQRRRTGPDDPNTLSDLYNLGLLYLRMERYTEAEPLFTDLLERQRRVLGTEHPRTLSTMNSLALVHKNLGRYATAEQVLLESLEIKQRVLGPEHLNTLNAVSNLAALYVLQKRYLEAQPLAERVVEARSRILGPDHPAAASAQTTLAEVYMHRGCVPEAQVLAGDAYDRLLAARGPEHSETRRAIALLADIYEAQHEQDAARRWRALLPEMSDVSEPEGAAPGGPSSVSPAPRSPEQR